jgi:hypothetical protein
MKLTELLFCFETAHQTEGALWCKMQLPSRSVNFISAIFNIVDIIRYVK